VEYAIARGWYDPSCGEPFEFAKAYGSVRDDEPQDLEYDPRQWSGQTALDGPKPLMTCHLPFAARPQEKVTVADVMALFARSTMRAAYHDMSADYMISPHWANDPSICMNKTQESFVVELREDTSDLLKAVYWRATGRPCAAPTFPGT